MVFEIAQANQNAIAFVLKYKMNLKISIGKSVTTARLDSFIPAYKFVKPASKRLVIFVLVVR